MSPDDFLVVARTLHAVGDDAHCKSASSRAYYAAYHQARAWHAALPVPGVDMGPPGGEHQQLINRLRHPGPGTPADLARMSKLAAARLEVLRARRIAADYHLGVPHDLAESTMQMEQSERLLNDLRP